MEKLNQKYDQLLKALETLEKALNALASFTKRGEAYNPSMTYEEEFCTYRDSVIQRFEYSVDLFWKYLKKYFETANISPDIKIPGEVIRTAKLHNLISLNEAETILSMIKSRNMTSYIYVEEFADFLAKQIPSYFATLKGISHRITPSSNNLQ